MDAIDVQVKRQELRKALEKVVGATKEIDMLMTDTPHANGSAHRSLKVKGGEYIIHRKDGSIQSTYVAKDGKKYIITIGVEK